MSVPSAALLSEAFFRFKKQASDGVCWVFGCRNASRTDRCLCHKHEMRRWREKQKKTADFCTLRDHAKARKIKFDITVDYWRGLTDAFGFYEAREDEILTIDRVDPTRGYEEGNMRVVTLSLNSFKSTRERYLPEHIQHMLDRRRLEMRSDNEKFLRYDRAADANAGYELELWEHAPAQTVDETCPF